MSEPCVFLSYAGADAFEADLLALALESSLSDLGVRVWNYRFDQPADQAGIARALRAWVSAHLLRFCGWRNHRPADHLQIQAIDLKANHAQL